MEIEQSRSTRFGWRAHRGERGINDPVSSSHMWGHVSSSGKFPRSVARMGQSQCLFFGSQSSVRTLHKNERSKVRTVRGV